MQRKTCIYMWMFNCEKKYFKDCIVINVFNLANVSLSQLFFSRDLQCQKIITKVYLIRAYHIKAIVNIFIHHLSHSVRILLNPFMSCCVVGCLPSVVHSLLHVIQFFLLFLKTLVQSNKIWYMYTYVTWGSREDEGSQGCPNAPPPPSGKIKYIRFSYLLSPNLGSVTLYNSALEIHPLI